MIEYTNDGEYNNAKAVLRNRPLLIEDGREEYFFQLGVCLRKMRMYFYEAMQQMQQDRRIDITFSDYGPVEKAYRQKWRTDEDPAANDYRETVGFGY